LETYERKIIPLPPGATASVNDTNAADASAWLSDSPGSARAPLIGSL